MWAVKFKAERPCFKSDEMFDCYTDIYGQKWEPLHLLHVSISEMCFIILKYSILLLLHFKTPPFSLNSPFFYIYIFLILLS